MNLTVLVDTPWWGWWPVAVMVGIVLVVAYGVDRLKP